MSVHEFVDLLLLQLDFGHFTMVVSQLLIIVVIGRLLITFQLIDRFLFFFWSLWSWLCRLTFRWWILLFGKLLQIGKLFRAEVQLLQL